MLLAVNLSSKARTYSATFLAKMHATVAATFAMLHATNCIM